MTEPPAKGNKSPEDLEEVLDQLEATDGDGEDVTVDDVLKAFGTRTHGPLLALAGLIAVTPVGGIPGAPTLMAVIIILIAGQMVIGARQFWIPGVVRRRAVSRQKLQKSAKVLRPVARFIDRILRPRLTVLVNGHMVYVIAATCILLALAMPPLELLPFAVMLPASAILVFGLALLAQDGLLAAAGLILTASVAYLAGTSLI